MMKDVIVAVLIKNAVVMICWTFLAWYFDKWWIALFSALFITHMNSKDESEDERW